FDVVDEVDAASGVAFDDAKNGSWLISSTIS
ncbi:unnamed protein product, partial [Rotaria magnacalcarata]